LTQEKQKEPIKVTERILPKSSLEEAILQTVDSSNDADYPDDYLSKRPDGAAEEAKQRDAAEDADTHFQQVEQADVGERLFHLPTQV
jgi:hypothetical protein